MEEPLELPHTKNKDISVNWDRAIYIDDAINENLVKRITPEILKFRQQSTDPITVAINSNGGSITSLDTILGLLRGPTQFSYYGPVITVVTNKAFSAAANLLSQGDYAVALQHSNVLFHDVRFGELADVTPSKALVAAKSLQDQNDSLALKLANHVIKRLVWVYLDQSNNFDKNNEKFSNIHNRYKSLIPELQNYTFGAAKVDISSFATILFSNLSITNQTLIHGVMTRLGKWVHLNNISDSYPTYRKTGSKIPGILDGAQRLYKELRNKSIIPESCQNDLKLMITLMISEIDDFNDFQNIIDESTRNFNLIQSMNDDKHRQTAIRLMLRHDSMFFDVEFEDLGDEAKKSAVQEALPNARLFWLFCVSLCRELFEGEHILTPVDCQLLGLVDEIAGGGPIQSRREFRESEKK
ncbi:MAG: ATP-dependent Clp protease proteolytic subunit [Pseudomonadota bacterium]